MQIIAVILCLGALSLSCQAGELSDRILDEINLARTQPRAYARIVAERGGGSRAAAEAVRFLESATPREPLGSSTGLEQAAEWHVRAQGTSGSVGHRSSGGSPFDRISHFGRWFGAAGENIDYGSHSARATVVRLIVDEGVAGRKHRANLFSKAFRVAGVAAGSHARYGTMCVMDFAGDFSPHGQNLAAR